MNHLVQKLSAGLIVAGVTLGSPAGASAQEYTFATLAGLAESPGAIDGLGSAARFNFPYGVAVDSADNLYVADTTNCTIRKVSSSGVVTTLAGLAGTPGSANGVGGAARFYYPCGVAADGAGNVYVADTWTHTIRKVTPGGVVSTWAGLALAIGNADGTGSAARFQFPQGVAADSAGNVYVADTSNHTLRKVTPDGAVTTLAGLAGNPGTTDGTGSAARFHSPSSVALDNAGTVYVADSSNHTLRKVTPAGVVTTLAGLAGSSGSADGVGSAARFNNPRGVVLDGDGNLYVADAANCTIRKVSSDGMVITLAGVAGSSGSADGMADGARFNYPYGLALDSAGNLVVAEKWNHSLRKVTPNGGVSTLVGPGGNIGNADGAGSEARFNYPQGVAVDRSGDVYVADTVNDTIRKVTPDGAVTTLAGFPGWRGSSDGDGILASFNYPRGVALDSLGYVYVADN